METEASHEIDMEGGSAGKAQQSRVGPLDGNGKKNPSTDRGEESVAVDDDEAIPKETLQQELHTTASVPPHDHS